MGVERYLVGSVRYFRLVHIHTSGHTRTSVASTTHLTFLQNLTSNSLTIIGFSKITIFYRNPDVQRVTKSQNSFQIPMQDRIPNLRRLMQIETGEEEENLGYEDLEEVLTDNMENHDEMEKSRDRRRRDHRGENVCDCSLLTRYFSYRVLVSEFKPPVGF